jgi:hypothetical protein
MTRQALIYSLSAFMIFSFTFAMAAEKKPGAVSTRATARAAVVAKAPNFRLAAFVDGNELDYTVKRKKGVASITRNLSLVGLYCVKPKDSLALPLDQIIPVVTAEYSYSDQIATIAQWLSGGSLCPVDTIAVQTLDDGGTGDWDVSNTVAFTILVP